MGNERGLPSLPRGLSRDLTVYLQSLAEFVLRLSGSVRGSQSARAVRAAEKAGLGPGTATIGQGAVQSDMLRRGCVTEDKLADGAVTAAKLGQSAVTSRAVMPGAVNETALAVNAVGESRLADGAVTADKLADKAITTKKLADGAVSRSKLGVGVLPALVAGTATNGETVALPGLWACAPVVAMTAFSLSQGRDGETEGNDARTGVSGLREVVDDTGAGTGVWEFDAVGSFCWAAAGYRREEAQ